MMDRKSTRTTEVGGPADGLTAGRFLLRLLDAVDEAGVPYCVLRNHEKLPEHVGHDVDILVAENARRRFGAVLNRILAENQWQRIRFVARFGQEKHFVVDKRGGSEVLHLDIFYRLHWKGIPLVPGRRILGRAVRRRGLRVASPADAAAVSLLKELLQSGRLRQKTRRYVHAYATEDPAGFGSALGSCLPDDLVTRLADGVRNSAWGAVESQCGAARSAVARGALRRSLVDQCCRWAEFLWLHVRERAWAGTGLAIVMVGPDGSGKTTVARALEELLPRRELFHAARYYHARFGILPELKTFKRILGRPARRAEEGMPPPSPNARGAMGALRALTYMVYYSLDFLLGRFVLYRRKMRSELVLFDRYFYDYAIQETFRRVPMWLVLLLSGLAPSPDLVIYLDCPAQSIRRRKQELSVREILWQQDRCRKLLRRARHAFRVRSDMPFEEEIAAIRMKVFDRMGRLHTRGATA